MLRGETESSAPARRREVQREALLDSPAHVTHLLSNTKYPPPYGAQYRQDALWEGGNEALPPLWHQFKALDESQYQDNTLTMSSWNRPLPGVRLDYPGDLAISGCEWHISPLGRSYFVYHNTRTTSWKKPTPKRPAGSLMPECIIEGHSRCIWSLACLGMSCDVMSASDDCSIRQWTRDGEPAIEALCNDGGGVNAIAVSPDETMIVCGSADGRLRLWNTEKGSVVGDPWEGHHAAVRSIDWSPSTLEIASASQDGTIRRWNPYAGRQIALPIETGHGWVYAVQYSPQGDKFASGGEDKIVRLWSKDGELLIEIKGHDKDVTSLCWSKDGAHIFSASFDGTMRKLRSIDGAETVVFRGHTHGVTSLCLTPNGSHLVSVSRDCSARIWDLKTNQSVGDPLLHDDELLAVAIFSDGKYIASAGLDGKVYVWSLEKVLRRQDGDQLASGNDANAKPDAKIQGHTAASRNIHLVPGQRAGIRGVARYGDNFWGNEATYVPRRAAQPASPSSLLHWRGLFGFLSFSAQPANAPQSNLRESKNWSFNLFPIGNSRRAVSVAVARDEDRYGIAPESDAEAAAAMERTSGDLAGSSTQSGQLGLETQGSQRRPTQTQGASGGTGEVSYEVSCCGFFCGRRRSPSHQS